MRWRAAMRIAPLVVVAIASAPHSVLAANPAVTLPTGQKVQPAGRLTTLGSFPTGVAVSPDGARLLVIAGPPLSSEGPPVLVEVINAATGTVLQTLKVNDAFQSAAWSGDGLAAYVAGGQDGAVHVFSAAHAGAPLNAGSDITVPSCSFVSGIVLDHDGHSIWAACPLDGGVHRIDMTSGTQLAAYAVPGADEMALSPDGAMLDVTDWRGATLTQIRTSSGNMERITVGVHPNAVTFLPDGRAVATDTGDATLATIEGPAAAVPAPSPLQTLAIGVVALLLVVMLARRRRWRTRAAGIAAAVIVMVPVASTPSPARPLQASAATAQAVLTDIAQVGRHSDAPNAIAVAPDGTRLFVSLGADNAVAELVPASGAQTWRVAGLIPTGWYPVAVTVSPDGATLYVVTARGLASSAAATNPYVAPDPVDTGVNAAYATAGTLETIAVPDAATLAADTETARAGISVPAITGSTPLVLGAAGPIHHVIYVTRENKTYDADLGDLHPGPQNALTLFGKTNTPNLHALETQFAEAQDFYYPGFRSTVGHMWEDAGGVADVYERATGADTGALQGDWSNQENYPASGLLVEQAYKAGLTVRTYNEELAQHSHLLPDAMQAPTSVFPNYDLAVSDTSREMGWETEFHQFETHQCAGTLAATYGASCGLPALEYVYLGEDHTTVVDEPGYSTVEAQVADNDYATGRLIDAVSHSADWASTLVVVVEDDPQGTGDDVSAYHGFIAVASPWIRRGYITTVQYELPSVVGAIDRLLGLPALTDFVAEARPLDDLFSATEDATPFVADASGIALYPFTPLPGAQPASDAAHGIFSFATPDQTDPALAWRSTWMQIKGHAEP